MDKKDIIQAFKKLKKDSKSRNFVQSVDMVITLRDINMKSSDEQVDFFTTLHNPMNKKKSVCALVGLELAEECEKVCDFTVTQKDFEVYKDKTKVKNLARNYDFFIAQGSLMSDVASIFGRYLGPRGKMPNPKIGAVVASSSQIKPLYDKLQKTLHVTAKKQPVVHTMVGKEDMTPEEIADNAVYLYNQLLHNLPKEHDHVKDIYLKLTMSKPTKI